MNRGRKIYGKGGKRLYDFCKSVKVWFDADELFYTFGRLGDTFYCKSCALAEVDMMEVGKLVTLQEAFDLTNKELRQQASLRGLRPQKAAKAW